MVSEFMAPPGTQRMGSDSLGLLHAGCRRPCNEIVTNEAVFRPRGRSRVMAGTPDPLGDRGLIMITQASRRRLFSWLVCGLGLALAGGVARAQLTDMTQTPNTANS